jgi:hypothetical protein
LQLLKTALKFEWLACPYPLHSEFQEEILKDCVLFSCQYENKHMDPKVLIQFTKAVQQLRGADGNKVQEGELMQEQVGRRKTVRNIHESHHFVPQKQVPLSLDTAFKYRISQTGKNNGKNTTYCMAL